MLALALLLTATALPQAPVPATRAIRVSLDRPDPADWAELRAAVGAAGAGLRWEPALRQARAPEDRPLILFVQEGEAAGEDGPVGPGDLLLLRAGERLELSAPVAALGFTPAAPLPAGLPARIRPDFDPRVTDTPGGCASAAGAYRRICLTWEEAKGPYVYRGLNAHRVRIRDSLTHFHPRAGGFDELYLVQDALPGAALIVGERLDDLLHPERLDRAAAAGLLREIPLRRGDLVLLPRGVAHRGIGGVLAQVIALPGFVPGAEIPLDDAIAAVNERFDLELPRHVPDTPFVAVVEQADRVRIEIGDTLCTEYRFAAGPRAFFHPFLLADGRALTRGFPFEPRPGESRDHPHHQGIWLAHGSVDGIDFWHDPEVEQRLIAIEEAFSRPGRGGFTTRHEWRAPDGRVVLRDRRRFTFTAAPGGERWLDADLLLIAPPDRPVRFGDTKEGTFAVRLAAPLRVEGEVATGTLLDSAGRRDGAVWGRRARWIAASGRIDGRPASLGLLELPGSFRSPTWWHARTYGLEAANPFGRHDFEGAPPGTGDFTLDPGGELRLRYRVVASPAVWPTFVDPDGDGEPGPAPAGG
ncbi:MAG: hypothetical protein D6702_12425 [Planctomycetota bacterium]|nr:MAG: hypothetical protein D6702_12425 [Planctomycetota bacterium]